MTSTGESHERFFERWRCLRPAHLLTLSDYLQQRSALETVGAASIAALIDEPVLFSAFAWLCKRRRGYPPCADVWTSAATGRRRNAH